MNDLWTPYDELWITRFELADRKTKIIMLSVLITETSILLKGLQLAGFRFKVNQ